jgi:hypothetical protein
VPESRSARWPQPARISGVTALIAPDAAPREVSERTRALVRREIERATSFEDLQARLRALCAEHGIALPTRGGPNA